MPRNPRTESHSAPSTVTPIASHSWILEATKNVEAAASALGDSFREEQRNPYADDNFGTKLQARVGDCFLALKPLRELVGRNEHGNFDRIPHTAYEKLAERLFAFAKTLRGILASAPILDAKHFNRVPVSRKHLRFIGDVALNGIRDEREEVERAIRDEAEELFADFPEMTPDDVEMSKLELFDIYNGEADDWAAEEKERERERKEAEQKALARFVAALLAVEPRPGETKEALAKRKASFERIVGYISEMAWGVDIERTIAIIDSGNGVKERLIALSQLPLFGNIMDASNRVIARLLKCSHTHVGTAKKELQTEMAKAKTADADVTPTDSGNRNKWDANEDDDNDPTDVAADKLTFVGKDSVRKGQRASKLSPTDRAADRADAKHDREADEWIAKHGR